MFGRRLLQETLPMWLTASRETLFTQDEARPRPSKLLFSALSMVR